MEKRSKRIPASEFKGLSGIEYFDFEEDFVEKNIRCIPMIVRFKMDKAGIKLKLDEWSRMTVEERIALATKPSDREEDLQDYRDYLAALINKSSHKQATPLAVDPNPGWADTEHIPELLMRKLAETDTSITTKQWADLTNLQRFALLKLCRPGHENRNFPKAIIEFGLTSSIK